MKRPSSRLLGKEVFPAESVLKKKKKKKKEMSLPTAA
jgi:hypothetical protein